MFIPRLEDTAVMQALLKTPGFGVVRYTHHRKTPILYAKSPPPWPQPLAACATSPVAIVHTYPSLGEGCSDPVKNYPEP